jgi:hypothetical protein
VDLRTLRIRELEGLDVLILPEASPPFPISVSQNRSLTGSGLWGMVVGICGYQMLGRKVFDRMPLNRPSRRRKVWESLMWGQPSPGKLTRQRVQLLPAPAVAGVANSFRCGITWCARPGSGKTVVTCCAVQRRGCRLDGLLADGGVRLLHSISTITVFGPPLNQMNEEKLPTFSADAHPQTVRPAGGAPGTAS